ncbi:hypothetical protein TSUD_147390 [Trifolium subterraneum]|uniref:Uncharacterized protein n=1 Tax=Trifolium subterraneum TaxID=3900 RepID=A0A2Z6MTE0_TRISU|nr:hypothetical protein TSUD_147390 [Trifolium subterraneum]
MSINATSIVPYLCSRVCNLASMVSSRFSNLTSIACGVVFFLAGIRIVKTVMFIRYAGDSVSGVLWLVEFGGGGHVRDVYEQWFAIPLLSWWTEC